MSNLQLEEQLLFNTILRVNDWQNTSLPPSKFGKTPIAKSIKDLMNNNYDTNCEMNTLQIRLIPNRTGI